MGRRRGWREGELNREREREMSRAGCCLWLSFIRALHLRFHVTNVCSVCSAVLLCISRNTSAVNIWVTFCTLELLPRTDPGPCHCNLHLTSNPPLTQKAWLCPSTQTHTPPHLSTVYQDKEEENQKTPCAIFIWQEPKKHKEDGEYVLMSQIYTSGGTTLSATAPRKHQKHICMPELSDTSIAFWHLQSGGEKKTPAFSDSDNGNRQPN